MRIVLDPKLLQLIEYDIWWSSDDNVWICVANRLPFVGAISGHGPTPEDALRECRVALNLAFESFNKD